MIVGLPRMHKEPGELRDFLPGFVSFLTEREPHLLSGVVIEEGYGSGMGFGDQDYLRISPLVKAGNYEDCLGQDVVVVVRAPSVEGIGHLREGAILMSMLHFPTQPGRNKVLVDRSIHGLGLDSIVDDRGRRLVEDISAVGWNGMETAFRELEHLYPRFHDPGREELRVTILGSGAVAGAAMFAAARYGDQDLHARMVASGAPGVEVTAIDYDLTRSPVYMQELLSRTDVLVDATRRPDPTKVIVPNEWLGWLPQHAVIVDLSADPYDFSVTPPIVKGIEGIPHGDLDHFVFGPNDPAFDRLPAAVETTHRRVSVSCYSWPGLHPRSCMEIYGAQLEPVMDILLSVPPERWDIASANHIERAVVRAEIGTWHHMNRSR